MSQTQIDYEDDKSVSSDSIPDDDILNSNMASDDTRSQYSDVSISFSPCPIDDDDSNSNMSFTQDLVTEIIEHDLFPKINTLKVDIGIQCDLIKFEINSQSVQTQTVTKEKQLKKRSLEFEELDVLRDTTNLYDEDGSKANLGKKPKMIRLGLSKKKPKKYQFKY